MLSAKGKAVSGDTALAPYSPDINVLDFQFWSVAQAQVNCRSPKTLLG